MVKLLDKNNKDYFDVGFLLEHSLEYLLEQIFGVKCLVHHGFMNKIG